jgi:hypothetical protein
MKMQVQRLAVLALVALGACSGESDDGAASAPSLLSLSKDEIRVGDSLEFIGEGYLGGDAGFTEIALEGDYVTEGGSYPVSIRFRPVLGSDTRLVWPYFGPYDIPFSPTGDQLGFFEGTATAVNLGADGSEAASRPLAVSLRVGPSILVRSLEPVVAGCAEPATRLLGGFRYRVVTEAVGIDPVDFTLEILDEPGGDGHRVFRQDADGALASFGDDGDLTLAPAADGQVFYVLAARITARDAGGQKVESEYGIGVHRPLEYIDVGQSQLAELEAALPVSGCESGGTGGRQVVYAEQSRDLRERQIATTWNESWAENHGDQFSQPEANDVSLRFRQTATTGWTADWRDGDAIVGQVSMTQAAEWALLRSFGAGRPGSRPVGNDLSSGDSEAWAYGDEWTEVVIGSDGFWRIASSDVIPTDTSADITAGMFGVWYRQTSRLARPGAIVAYNLCGAALVSGEATFVDYTWATSLAEGSECPPFPQPDLPAAECFIAPCSE